MCVIPLAAKGYAWHRSFLCHKCLRMPVRDVCAQVLDGDMTLLHGQERNLEAAGGKATAFFLPTQADRYDCCASLRVQQQLAWRNAETPSLGRVLRPWSSA